MLSNLLLILLISVQLPTKPYVEIDIMSLNNDALQFFYKDSTKDIAIHGGYHGFVFRNLVGGKRELIQLKLDTLKKLIGFKFDFAILQSNTIRLYGIKIFDGKNLYEFDPEELFGLYYNQHITSVDFNKIYWEFESPARGSVVLNYLMFPNLKNHYLELYCKYDKSDLTALRYKLDKEKSPPVRFKHVAKGSFQKLIWPVNSKLRFTNFRLDLSDIVQQNTITVKHLKYVLNGKSKVWDYSNWNELDILDLELVNNSNLTVILSTNEDNSVHDPMLYFNSKIVFDQEILWHKIKYLIGFILITIIFYVINKFLINVDLSHSVQSS